MIRENEISISVIRDSLFFSSMNHARDPPLYDPQQQFLSELLSTRRSHNMNYCESYSWIQAIYSIKKINIPSNLLHRTMYIKFKKWINKQKKMLLITTLTLELNKKYHYTTL